MRSFVDDTAGKTGKHRASIARDATRAKALGPDLDRVAGTSLDKGAELDALAAMPAEARGGQTRMFGVRRRRSGIMRLRRAVCAGKHPRRRGRRGKPGEVGSGYRGGNRRQRSNRRSRPETGNCDICRSCKAHRQGRPGAQDAGVALMPPGTQSSAEIGRSSKTETSCRSVSRSAARLGRSFAMAPA